MLLKLLASSLLKKSHAKVTSIVAFTADEQSAEWREESGEWSYITAAASSCSEIDDIK
jgi:uncharacterized phage-like protein YoqJ